MKTQKEYTNKYGKTFRIGQIGISISRFSNSETTYKIVSFTDNGKYMRCKRLDIPSGAPERIKNQLYLFSTDNCTLKGSHLGNCHIEFKHQ